MLRIIRASFVSALGASLLLSILMPTTASAAFWPGFPFSPPPAGTEIPLPEPARFNLCAKEIKAAGITVYVPRPCSKTTPPPPPTTATLTLIKTVVNDDGGSAVAADFQAKIDGTNVSWGVAQTVSTGAHTASETGLAGYSASSWGGDCAADGSITLAAGENKTCTITNDDQSGILRVVKVVVNDNGGVKTAADFEFMVNGGAATAFEADGQNDISVDAGVYSVVEAAESGYTTSYSNCSNVAIANGETEVCTITNNDGAPAPTTATLTLVKQVVNDDGGTAVAADWTLFADGPTDIEGMSGTATVTNATVQPGDYTLSEFGGPTVYDASQYSCVKNGGAPVVSNSVTLAAGDTAVCTITNNDQQGYIVVSKLLVNDNGGTGTTTDFSFRIDGGDPITFTGTQMIVPVDAGVHSVTEVAASGYATTYENNQNANANCDNLVVKNGNPPQPLPDVAACLITNNDNPPPPQGALLITEVLYDVGEGQGEETTNEWVELRNGTNAAIDLTDYVLADNTSGEIIPDGTIIPAGGILVFTSGTNTAELWSIPVEKVVVLSSAIGNGLALNDNVRLLDPAQQVVDGVSWGTNTDPLNPGATGVAAGSSLARTPMTTDTNTAADWAEDTTPTPGS